MVCVPYKKAELCLAQLGADRNYIYKTLIIYLYYNINSINEEQSREDIYIFMRLLLVI